MVYGYARVITMGQARESNSLEVQESALQQAGTERIFWDVFSRKPERRPQSFVLNMGIIDNIPTGRLILHCILVDLYASSWVGLPAPSSWSGQSQFRNLYCKLCRQVNIELVNLRKVDF